MRLIQPQILLLLTAHVKEISRRWAQFEVHKVYVILSVAVFQAQRRISRSTGVSRKPKLHNYHHCLTRQFSQSLRCGFRRDVTLRHP
jgi:hypothetical protein